jgi:hypothetical protein
MTPETRKVGIETVVSLLESSEVRELEQHDEASCCEASGIEFISFPIRDDQTKHSK